MNTMYGLKRDDSVILSIDRDVTTIGRHTSNNIVINALPVSRHHSCIVKIDGRYFIRDNNTINGTFIKKHKLLPERETLIKVGDVIGIGGKAGDDPKCSFEVVVIQFDKILPTREEKPSVDSSTDSDTHLAQSHIWDTHQDTKEHGVNNSISSTSEKTSNADHNQSLTVVRNVDDNHVPIPSFEFASCSKSVTSNSAIKVEPSNRSAAAIVPMPETLEEAITKTVSKPSSLNSEESIAQKIYVKEARTNNSVQNSLDGILYTIDLCNDDDKEEAIATNEEEEAAAATVDVDIKPLFSVGTPYSTSDEIILLDSDDDDFPCSQLNATPIDDLPGLLEDEVDNPDGVGNLYGTEDTWFESCRKELIVDLPMKEPQKSKDRKKKNSTSISLENETAVDQKEAIKHGKSKHSGDPNANHESSKRRHSVDDVDASMTPSKRKTSFGCDESKSAEKKESFYSGKIHDSLPKSCQPVVLIPVLKDDTKLKRKTIEVLSNEEVFQLRQKKHKKKRSGPKSEMNLCEPSTSAEQKPHSKRDSVEIVDKKQMKELRIKKLKELALKKNPTTIASKPESSNRDVVAKCTNKNRSAKMNDDLCNVLPSMPGYDYKELEVAPGCEERRKELHGYDSLYDDALDLCSQSVSSSSQNVSKEETKAVVKEGKNTNVLSSKVVLKEKTKVIMKEEKHTSVPTSESKHLSKRSVYTHNMNQEFTSKDKKNVTSLCSPSFEEDLLSVEFWSEKRKEKHKPLMKEATPVSEISECKKNNCLTEEMSPQAPGFYINTMEQRDNTKKKKVHFYEGITGCILDFQTFHIDPEEHHPCGPGYKFSELMKEKMAEFEWAIAHACSWNIIWLKEQEVNKTPPPLYIKYDSSGLPFRKLIEYKENLKEAMFHSLWNAITLASQKLANQDYHPNLTQCIIDGNKEGVHSLQIESVSVDRTSSPLWTISTYRVVDENSVCDDLTGQMVYLSFRMKWPGLPNDPKKTNCFAYIASSHQVRNIDGVERQRIVFKIADKKFEIVMGEIKMKVLTYTKPRLKRFQALAMLNKYPLIDLFTGERSEVFMVPTIHAEQNFVDTSLDSSQKEAMHLCLNSILSSEPSICLVDGPPGTGKSRLIQSLMNELFFKVKRKQFPINLKVLIVTTNDNIADHVVSRLEKRDNSHSLMNVLRYGFSRSNNPRVKSRTIEERIRRLIEEDEDDSLINLEEEKRILVAQKNSVKLVLDNQNLTKEKRMETVSRMSALEKKYADLSSHRSKHKDHLLYLAAKNKALEDANVIVTSVDMCWKTIFEEDFVPTDANKGDVYKFTVCVFDDANYLEEDQMLTPIMLMVPTLILVGDSSNKFYCKKRDQAPFCRLVRDFTEKKSNALVRLKRQFRMESGLFKWLSKFYRLPPCDLKQSKKMSRLVPMLVVHLQDEDCFDFDHNFRAKWETQAKFCYRLAIKILLDVESDYPIAIIVVTDEEKRCLQGMIAYCSDIIERNKIQVYTVEDTKGREYEIVICCFPMNPQNIDSWLYVASSRARSHLFMCGFFEDEFKNNNQSFIRRLIVDAELKKICIKWNVNNEFRTEFLRSRQSVGS